jgi:hypothetical protein
MSDAIAAWIPFYAYLGLASATVLGLLFVALTLRLNVFRSAQVADVRLFTLQTYLTIVFVVATAALVHVPGQTAILLGGATAAMSLVLLAIGAAAVRDTIRLTTPEDPFPIWLRALSSVAVLLILLVWLVAGVAILAGVEAALFWLAMANLVAVVLASFGIWEFLSNAPG